MSEAKSDLRKRKKDGLQESCAAARHAAGDDRRSSVRLCASQSGVCRDSGGVRTLSGKPAVHMNNKEAPGGSGTLTQVGRGRDDVRFGLSVALCSPALDLPASPGRTQISTLLSILTSACFMFDGSFLGIP